MNFTKSIVSAALTLCALSGNALTITKTAGWFESIGVEWEPVDGAAKYAVLYSGPGASGLEIDPELVRLYPGYLRADIPGIAPGSYTVSVIAADASGAEIDRAVSEPVTVRPFVREGFAFRDGYLPGAYKADGTPKDGADIIYVTPATANTVTLTVVTDAKGKTTQAVGLMNIIKAKNKGYDKTPLIIRVTGCLTQSDVTGLKSNNYIDFTGANNGARMIENVTLEGVGNDATLKGFGVFTKRSHGIEVRNLGIMLFGDDGVSMEADNSNIWVHNCDFFYGSPGKDKDQVKGDGSIDMKYNTTDITIDHNHFWDSGKSTFAGGATESNPIYFTYHHNWFDHADSRCPRLCHASAHIYNNYFDANPTMCLLSTENTSAFVESNYYRNCPSPMEINMQGTNRRRWPDGTQNGGMNKGYGNICEGDYELITQHDNATDFDVWVVDDRAEQLPATVRSLKGGNVYDNFDTSAGMYAYTPDEAADVPARVTADAGRMEGGDLKWQFDNATDDASTAIDPQLKAALTAYTGSYLGLAPVATGISDIVTDADADPAVIYDLQGRRYDRLPSQGHGVYIVRRGDRVVKIVR